MTGAENKKVYKYSAAALILFLIAVIGGLSGYILVGPYDPGTLTVTGSCGNLSHGGYINNYQSIYTYYAENGSMYCMDSDGGKTIILDDKNISCINPDKNYIYYLTDGKIFSIHNRLEKKQLSQTEAAYMSVNGGWIYFTDKSGDLWKISTGGDYQRRVGEVNVTGSFAVDNGFIYYVNGNMLYKIRANGLESTRTVLAEDAAGYFSYFDSAIFYENTKGEIISMSAESGGSKLKREDSELFNFGYGTLAFTDSDGILHVKDYSDDREYYCEDFTDKDLKGIFVLYDKSVYVIYDGTNTPYKANLTEKD